jgi:hypothetical protein
MKTIILLLQRYDESIDAIPAQPVVTMGGHRLGPWSPAERPNRRCYSCGSDSDVLSSHRAPLPLLPIFLLPFALLHLISWSSHRVFGLADS